MKAIELDNTELTFHNNLAAVYFEMKEYDKVNLVVGRRGGGIQA